MPSIAHSTRTTLIVQEEAQWGVVNAGVGALAIDYISETLRNEISKSGTRHIIGRRSAEPMLAGGHDPKGEILGELQPHGFWPLMLKHALGSYDGAFGSGPYTHVLSGGESLPPGLTLEKRFGFRNGTVKRLRYAGSRVDNFFMRAGGDQIIAARVGLVMRQEIEALSDMDAAPRRPLDNAPFNSLHGQLILMERGEAVAPLAHLRSVELQIANKLNSGDRPIVSGDLRGSLPHGRREVSGALSAFFTPDNYRLYEGYRANGRFRLQFTLSRSPWSLAVLLPSIQFYATPTPQVGARGPVTLEMTWTAQYDEDEGLDIQATLVNNSAELATAA